MRVEREIEVGPINGRSLRTVSVKQGDLQYRDSLNTDSAQARQRFIKGAAKKFGVDAKELEALDDELIHAAEQVDEQAAAKNNGGSACSSGCCDASIELSSYAPQTEYFHDAHGAAYARFRVDGHYQVAAVKSLDFRKWLSHQHYRMAKKAISSKQIKEDLELCEARALFDGEERSVHLRVAQQDGKIYLDLCNAAWQVVEISPVGWRVLDDSPVMFRRSKGMLPLPIPVEGGHLAEFREFINLQDHDWPLVAGWLVMSLNPAGPFPLLAVHGEQGSAKSTFCMLLRSLMDPNQALLRSAPRLEQDIVIAANNGWLVGLDNLSHLNPNLSDTLCRISTGGGFATRTFYTNSEETFFDAQRPVLLNGIEEVATRSDLLDRSLLLSLTTIPEERRRTEAEITAAFETAHPRLLGALLSAVAQTLRERPNTRLDKLPRMADFALWATAAEPALGLAPGEFMRAYDENRADADRLVVSANAVGNVFKNFSEEVKHWSGTATKLLRELNLRADDLTQREKDWPKSARVLSAVLRRLAPNLRRLGVEVKFDERVGRNGERLIRLSLVSQGGIFASAASAASVEGPKPEPVRLRPDRNRLSKTPVFTEEFWLADATDAADANLQASFTWPGANEDVFLRRLFGNVGSLAKPGEKMRLNSARAEELAAETPLRFEMLQQLLQPADSELLMN